MYIYHFWYGNKLREIQILYTNILYLHIIYYIGYSLYFYTVLFIIIYFYFNIFCCFSQHTVLRFRKIVTWIIINLLINFDIK